MIKDIDFILASGSKRRKELLENNDYRFKIITSDSEKNIVGCNYDRKLLVCCAKDKALQVAAKTDGDNIIVSADTIVVLDDIIIGKPKDDLDAINILHKLSNKTHFVETCIFIIKVHNKKYLNCYLYDVARTYITFRKLITNEIIDYINNFKPFDKAGSYGIQDEGFDFVEKIDGDINNVIGFPVNLFDEMIKEFI